MAILKNTTINDTGSILLPRGGTEARPGGTGVYTFLNEYWNSGNHTWVCPIGVTSIEYLVVAGGGGGGSGYTSQNNGGGGGGGGVLTGTVTVTPGSTYTIAVGAGGDANANGGNSYITGTGVNITAIGGGKGGGLIPTVAGGNGGSGGGGAPNGPTAGGLGTAGQGNNGAAGNPASPYHGGGGGGAGGAGVTVGGTGGIGIQSSIEGTAKYYGGGGGGGADTNAGQGGLGGGGNGGLPSSTLPTAGAAYTGGGGGGGASQGNAISGAAGGSGIIIIKQAVPSAATSMLRYNTTNNRPEVYTGSGWKNTTTPGGMWLYYDEGIYAHAYTANWNNATVYSMADFGGLGYVTAHGHVPATNLTLTLNNLPSHSMVRYKVFWHCVDSLDTETSNLYLTNASGTETEFFRFTKLYSTSGFNTVVLQSGADAFWSGTQTYTYAPWTGSSQDGYITFDSGYYAHAGSSFSARHYIGADQAVADESMYLSHVQLWLKA